jgi:hypothetical protein
MSYLIEFLGRILSWLVDLLLWVPHKLYGLLLDAFATIIEAIPVPEFMSSLGSLVAGLDPAIAYFAVPLQLGTGMTWVFSALVLRFLIRRIPVIG